MTTPNISRTALGAAALRAAHQVLDAPPLILDDPVIGRLLGPGALRRIHEHTDRYQTPQARALRAHMVLRSRFAEDRLATAVQRGVRQYLVLGAGFDTFALRQPAWAHGLRIVEVDQPSTQGLKRSSLADAGLAAPANAAFAPIDFERESLREGLRRHQVADDVPTFCSWLGVTMYLTDEAIDAVLQTVAMFPAGSELVLTFAQSRPALSPLAQRAAELGEPWVSFFTPEALEAKLHDAGFAEVGFLTPQAAVERYFQQRPDGLPPPRQTTIAYAVR